MWPPASATGWNYRSIDFSGEGRKVYLCPWYFQQLAGPHGSYLTAYYCESLALHYVDYNNGDNAPAVYCVVQCGWSAGFPSLSGHIRLQLDKEVFSRVANDY